MPHAPRASSDHARPLHHPRQRGPLRPADPLRPGPARRGRRRPRGHERLDGRARPRPGFAVRSLRRAAARGARADLRRARELDHDAANRLVVTEAFVGLDGAAALGDLCAIVADWRPDLVLCESAEFAGPLAAERSGVPVAVVGIGARRARAKFMPDVIAALAPLRARLGLPAEPGAARLLHARAAAARHAGRPARAPLPRAPRARRAPLPDWWDGDDAPLVYLTLGTVAPQMGFFPGLYRAALDALARAAGPRARHDRPRPRPGGPRTRCRANVHAERWVPQAAVMPHAAAMACHGGFGTVRAGLAAGVPLAVLPLFADQPDNARRVARARGRRRARRRGRPGDPRSHALLDEPAYARRGRGGRRRRTRATGGRRGRRELRDLADTGRCRSR